MNVDVVCPLYRANEHIDALLLGILSQKGISLGKVIFPVTRTEDDSLVLSKIAAAGFSYFSVTKEEFSHSLTREKAIFDYCENDVVILLTQDVVLFDENAFLALSQMISERTVYAFGKQICRKKSIERYIRENNYKEISQRVSASDIEKMQLNAFFSSDAFSAIYRPVFLSLKGYGGASMMMNEDMFYAKRVIDAGYEKGYCAEAVVEHFHELSLKQLYHRYAETGKWFSQHPEFNRYKATDSGFKLALYVFKSAIKRFDIPVLLRWLPDMAARYLGMKHGKKLGKGVT